MKQNKFISMIKSFLTKYKSKNKIKSIKEKEDEMLDFLTALEEDNLFLNTRVDLSDTVGYVSGYKIKHSDDRIAYVPSFCPISSSLPIVEKTYVEQGRPINSEQYKKLVMTYVNKDNFNQENNSFVLYKIWSDAKKINSLLEPLNSFGIEYTLELTGGSVRDFLLGNADKIKDLDFMLSLGFVGYNKTQEMLESIQKYFTKEELDSVSWYENLNEEKIKKDESVLNHNYNFLPLMTDTLKRKVLELCLKRKNPKYEIFYKKSRQVEISKGDGSYFSEDTTKTDRLIAVAKLDKNDYGVNYPVDILLTDFIKPAFLKDFDFDICKASICFVNKTIDKEFPKSTELMLGRFVADVDFWADVMNKKITYDVSTRSQYEIDRSFDSHLSRIKEKYPDYEVNVVGNREDLKIYTNAKLLSIALTNRLENQLKENKKKIKI